MYDAWHVRLNTPVKVDGVETNTVMVMEDDLVSVPDPIVQVVITSFEWKCPNCDHDNRNDTSTEAMRGLVCSECKQHVYGVLVDSGNDILIEGCPFPE